MLSYARGYIRGSAFDIASQILEGEKEGSRVLVSPKCQNSLVKSIGLAKMAASSSPLI